MIFPRPQYPGGPITRQRPAPTPPLGARSEPGVTGRSPGGGRCAAAAGCLPLPPGSGGGVEVHLVVLDVDVGVVVVERVLVERVLDADAGLGFGVVEGVVDLHVGVVVVERVVDVDVRGLVEADVPDLGVACRVVLADGDVLGVLDVGDRLADDDVVHVGAVAGGAVVGRAVVGR